MFTIKGPKKGVVWDVTANRPMIQFKNGEAATNDPAIAEKLSGLGYAVTGETDPPTPAQAGQDGPNNDSGSNDTPDNKKPVEGKQDGDAAKTSRRKRGTD